MFCIGSRTWPGLSKLIEEFGEVLQIAGKLIATGGERKHYSGIDLKVELENEIGDALAAAKFLATKNNLDHEAINARCARKLALFEQWHREQLAREGLDR